MGNSIDIKNNTKSLSSEKEYMDCITLTKKLLLNRDMLNLSEVTVMEPREIRGDNEFVLLQIARLSYEKGQSLLDQFETVINVMAHQTDRCNLALIIDGTVDDTKLYLAVRAQDSSISTSKQLGVLLEDTLRGNLPGVEVKLLSVKDENNPIKKRIQAAGCVSIYSSVPGSRTEQELPDDQSFVQGIERYIDAMQGHQYTAIILAQRASTEDFEKRLHLCQRTKDYLVPLKEKRISLQFQLADLVNTKRTKSEIESTTHRECDVTSSEVNRQEQCIRPVIDENLENAERVCDMANIVFDSVANSSANERMKSVGQYGKHLVNVERAIIADKRRKAPQELTTESINDVSCKSNSSDRSTSEAVSAEQNDEVTDQITVTLENSYVVEDIEINRLLKLIDEQTKRLFISESGGLWSTAGYFLSQDGGFAVTEHAMKIFHGIMQGRETGVETVAMNNFQSTKGADNIKASLCQLCHPVCASPRGTFLPAVYLNSRELSRMLSFPRKSVCGLSVVPAISLATQVERFDLTDERNAGNEIQLGYIYNYRPIKTSGVNLCIQSLTQHLFVTGSTGSGKSNSVKLLLKKAHQAVNNLHTLIIEPSSKAEYKKFFPNWKVFGTSWKCKTPLELNPFLYDDRFVTLESHVNNLKALFVSCWDMSAAMPEILEQAIYSAYAKAGRVPGLNPEFPTLYPTVTDLIEALSETINEYDFHAEVKSNYIGALTARVRSLTFGSYKYVFSGHDMGNESLFEQNAIVDLTELGFEEKALMMGLIVLRLNEYLRSQEFSATLKHITVIEEAHHLFGADTQESAFGHNIQKVQREAFANLLAEVRTYGESIIIVDQSPNKMDLSVIRNTNTKIVHRLPEAGDCAMAGHSVNLPEDKLDILSRLPNGHAVIYQESWLSPVVCAVEKFKPDNTQCTTEGNELIRKERQDLLLLAVADFLLCRKEKRAIIPGSLLDSCDQIKRNINDLTGYSTSLKVNLLGAINDFNEAHWTDLWIGKQHLLKFITPLIKARTGETAFRLIDDATSYDITKPLNEIWDRYFGQKFEKHKESIIEAILFCYSQSSTDREDRVKNVYKNKIL